MNAKVSDALEITRSILGDDISSQWTDPTLFPKIVQAHKELVAKLILNGISAEIKTTARTTVTAGSLNLGGNAPTDLIRIINMYEVAPGDDISNAVPMTVKAQIPNVDQTSTLRYWVYNLETITFLGATEDRDIILTYFRQPADPTNVNSILDFQLSEIFLGPRAAALAVITKDANLYGIANQMAEDNLSKIVRIQVKGDQSLPVRRRPFSHANRRSRIF